MGLSLKGLTAKLNLKHSENAVFMKRITKQSKYQNWIETKSFLLNLYRSQALENLQKSPPEKTSRFLITVKKRLCKLTTSFQCFICGECKLSHANIVPYKYRSLIKYHAKIKANGDCYEREVIYTAHFKKHKVFYIELVA